MRKPSPDCIQSIFHLVASPGHFASYQQVFTSLFSHHSLDINLCAFAAGVAIEDDAQMADNKKQLVALLDAAEAQLSKTACLAAVQQMSC